MLLRDYRIFPYSHPNILRISASYIDALSSSLFSSFPFHCFRLPRPEDTKKMKFGKSLNTQIEEALPEWRDKFLCYKELKKKLKLINGEERSPKRLRSDSGKQDEELQQQSREEIEFINCIEDEIEKFNNFFFDKEEDFVIQLKHLQDRLVKASGRANESKYELFQVLKEIVNFHGEMVLLENYSALNYTGLVKILKKYAKRTGAFIRTPYSQKVLQQPFHNTQVLSKLVKQCARMLDLYFPAPTPSEPSLPTPETETEPSPSPSLPSADNAEEGETSETIPAREDGSDLEEIKHMKNFYLKSTLTALRGLEEIRSKSSTVNPFSLPPLQSSSLDEKWKKFPSLEQEAAK